MQVLSRFLKELVLILTGSAVISLYHSKCKNSYAYPLEEDTNNLEVNHEDAT